MKNLSQTYTKLTFFLCFHYMVLGNFPLDNNAQNGAKLERHISCGVSQDRDVVNNHDNSDADVETDIRTIVNGLTINQKTVLRRFLKKVYSRLEKQKQIDNSALAGKDRFEAISSLNEVKNKCKILQIDISNSNSVTSDDVENTNGLPEDVNTLTFLGSPVSPICFYVQDDAITQHKNESDKEKNGRRRGPSIKSTVYPPTGLTPTSSSDSCINKKSGCDGVEDGTQCKTPGKNKNYIIKDGRRSEVGFGQSIKMIVYPPTGLTPTGSSDFFTNSVCNDHSPAGLNPIGDVLHGLWRERHLSRNQY